MHERPQGPGLRRLFLTPRVKSYNESNLLDLIWPASLFSPFFNTIIEIELRVPWVILLLCKINQNIEN